MHYFAKIFIPTYLKEISIRQCFASDSVLFITLISTTAHHMLSQKKNNEFQIIPSNFSKKSFSHAIKKPKSWSSKTIPLKVYSQGLLSFI